MLFINNLKLYEKGNLITSLISYYKILVRMKVNLNNIIIFNLNFFLLLIGIV